MDVAAFAPAEHAPVSTAYRRYALSLLLAIYTLNFLDRQIVTILVEPIKTDLQLQDWQLGMMTGAAFAALYTVLGLPIARLAERRNRPVIIAVATALWSVFTVLCGFARNFSELVLARVGVGIGEAGCTPPAHSLISDYVPREQRASAMAFYHLGTPLGSILGLVIGGLVADKFGWRAAFMVAGAPGALAALVALLTLREPRRSVVAVVKPSEPGLRDALRELAGKRTFWLIALGTSIVAFNGYGAAAFAGSFYLRNHGTELTAIAAGFGLKPIGFIGVALAMFGGIAGMIGVWLGGQLGDRYGRRDMRANMAIPAVGALLAIPMHFVGLLVGPVMISLVAIVIPNIFGSLWYGPIYSTTQGLVQPRTRATASALLLFIVNLIGLGLGPLCVGVLSDYLANGLGWGPAEGIRWSLLLFSLLGLAAAALFWGARRTILADLAS